MHEHLHKPPDVLLALTKPWLEDYDKWGLSRGARRRRCQRRLADGRTGGAGQGREGSAQLATVALSLRPPLCRSGAGARGMGHVVPCVTGQLTTPTILTRPLPTAVCPDQAASPAGWSAL